jgi:hypothetical protein
VGRNPPPLHLALVVEGGLEDGCGQRGLHVQRVCAGIAEAVPAAGRDDHRLTCRQRGAVVFDPHLGGSVQDSEHLLDGVQMGGCAATGHAPLLEQADLHRAGEGRDAHARRHTGAPFVDVLPLVIDDLHCNSRIF